MATYQVTQQRTLVVDREAEKHNAQISERYQRLKNAEEQQFAEFTQERAYTATYTPEFNAPVQQPQVPEYAHTRVDSPLFTVETLERTLQRTETAYAPVQQPTVEAAVVAEMQPTYSLTSMAKKAIVAASAVTVALLSVICVNSSILRTQAKAIAEQEAMNAAARVELARIQNDISVATSEEAIAAWATENGMVKAD